MDKEAFEIRLITEGKPAEKGLLKFETEDGVYAVHPTGKDGKSLGWFGLPQIKLHLIKRMINSLAPVMFSLVATGAEEGDVDPATGDPQPEQLVSKLTDKIWDRLYKALKYEETKGLLTRDRNMSKLLKAGRNALVYVVDQDNYYRVWWGYLLTVIWEEMQMFYDQWKPWLIDDPRFKALRWEQNGKKIGIKDAVDNPQIKKGLFYWFLCGHLPYLAKGYNVTMKDVKRRKIEK